MAVAALKYRPPPEPELKTFHATMLVTRVEEWCVEAGTLEEARELFERGKGHRCNVGERIHAELQDVLDN